MVTNIAKKYLKNIIAIVTIADFEKFFKAIVILPSVNSWWPGDDMAPQHMVNIVSGNACCIVCAKPLHEPIGPSGTNFGEIWIKVQ